MGKGKSLVSLPKISFNADGLVPAIVQDHASGEVLMLAYMNEEALAETLKTGRACFYSRSRKQLWRKGESSGQVQYLKDLRYDCDKDTVLLQVEQVGVACHTGRRSCFYRAFRNGEEQEILKVQTDPKELYGAS